MSQPSDPTLRIDPDQLSAAIEAYERAATQVLSLANNVLLNGRLERSWARDEISISMADHYNYVMFDGQESTYAAILAYERELRSLIRLLRATMTEYDRTDAGVAMIMGGRREGPE